MSHIHASRVARVSHVRVSHTHAGTSSSRCASTCAVGMSEATHMHTYTQVRAMLRMRVSHVTHLRMRVSHVTHLRMRVSHVTHLRMRVSHVTHLRMRVSHVTHLRMRRILQM